MFGILTLTLRTQKHLISGKVCDRHIPLDRFFINLHADITREACVLITPNSCPELLFRGTLVAPASALLCGPQHRSGSPHGRGPVSRLSQIVGQGRFFGPPWWLPPAHFSGALNFGLSARAGMGWYLGPLTGIQQGKLHKKNQSQNPPRVPRPRHRPPPRGEQSPPALRSQVLNLFAFATCCRAKNYLQDSVCSFQSRRRARRSQRGRRRLEHLRAASLGHRNTPREPPQQVGSVKSLVVCLSHSPSEIWPNTHFVFIPQLVAIGKGSAKPPPPTLTVRRCPHQTATPQAPSTLRLRRARTRRISSSRTTSSESSQSEPEEAPAENLSTGWSERVTRVDTQLNGDHVGPKISQTTSTTRAPHFPSSSCSLMPISGAPGPPNKPASQAGQAVQARFILRQEF